MCRDDDPIFGEPFYTEEGVTNPLNDRGQFYYGASFFQSGNLELSFYLIGMVWSGTLWDLRQTIQKTADTLAVESLHYIPANVSFQIGAAALVQADVDHHHGNHVAQILQACSGRGFSIEPVTATINGPATIYPNQNVQYVASVAYGVPPYALQWTATGHSPGGDTELDLGTGTQATVASGSFTSVDLRLRATDASGDVRNLSRSILVCSSDPPGSGPLVVSIVKRQSPGNPRSFSFTAALSGGDCYQNLAYRWATRCHDPGCGLEERGTTPSISISSNRNFDVFLWVTTVTNQDSASKVVWIDGMPTVSIDGDL